MNTFCRITAEVEDSAYLEQVIEEAFQETRRLENLFSRYLNESPVSKINSEAEKSPVAVSEEIFNLIARALEISRLTEGAFDISIGAGVDFWRQCERDNYLPRPDQIEALKNKISYKYVTLDYQKKTLSFTRPGIKIDLGAIAKGYALDKVIAVLRERGIAKAQISLGGNIYVLGPEAQVVGIRDPLSPEELATTIEIASSSISTSANYERFFTIASRKFGHLLNPLTVCPVEEDILSASIISQDALLADALSTAIFALGFNKSRELLKRFSDVEAVVLRREKFARGFKVFQLKGNN